MELYKDSESKGLFKLVKSRAEFIVDYVTLDLWPSQWYFFSDGKDFFLRKSNVHDVFGCVIAECWPG